MPDTNLPNVTKKVILEIEARDISATSKEIAKLSKMIQLLVKSNMSFTKAFDKTLGKGIKGTKKLTIRQKLYTRALKETIKHVSTWNNQLNQAAKSLAKGVIPFKSVEVLQKYNLQMIKATVGAKQHNISLNSLKSTFSSLSKSIHMTTMELAELFNAFRADAPIVNEKMFEKLSKNIEKVVGPSQEAIGIMMKEVIALQNLYPGLIKDTITLTKVGNKRINDQMNFAIHEGKFSAAQARRIKDYLGQQSKITEEKRAELAVFKDFEKHSLSISLLLANALVPALEKISKVFEKNKDSIKKFFDALGWFIGKAIEHWELFLVALGIGKLAMPIIGKRIVGRAAGRAAGGAIAGQAAAGGAGASMMGSAKWLVAHPGVIALVVAATAAIAVAYYANEYGKAKEAGIRAEVKFGRKSKFFDEIGNVYRDTEKGSEERKKQLDALYRRFPKESSSYREVREKDKREKARKEEEEAQAKINTAKIGEAKAIELFEKRLKIVSKAAEGQATTVAARTRQMQITGQIQPGAIAVDVEKAISRYKQTRDLVIKRLAAARKILVTQEKNGASLQAQSETQNTINKLAAVEYGLQEKIYTVTKNISKVLETRIKLSQLDVQFASMRVQLADNYAIGVGASVKLRMQEYEANKANILMQQKKLAAIEKEIALNGIKDKYIADRKEAEIEIMQAMMKQAQITRSIRDGWVEALMSMNTGASSFSKILMTQKKNTAQYLYTVKQSARLSKVSGAPGFGFTKAARYTGQLGMTTERGQGLAYPTSADQGLRSAFHDFTGELSRLYYQFNAVTESRMERVKARGGTTLGFVGDVSGYRLPAAVGGRKTVIVIEDRTEGGIKGAMKAGMAGQARTR